VRQVQSYHGDDRSGSSLSFTDYAAVFAVLERTETHVYLKSAPLPTDTPNDALPRLSPVLLIPSCLMQYSARGRAYVRERTQQREDMHVYGNKIPAGNPQ
jgi:hypothetical protein